MPRLICAYHRRYMRLFVGVPTAATDPPAMAVQNIN